VVQAIATQLSALDRREETVDAEIARLRRREEGDRRGPQGAAEPRPARLEDVVSSGVFITVVLGILAANVASVTVIAKLLGDRIGDIVGRIDRLEKRSDERFDSSRRALTGSARRSSVSTGACTRSNVPSGRYFRTRDHARTPATSYTRSRRAAHEHHRNGR
jgi:hypothetical protein